jgi:hypothetical protein
MINLQSIRFITLIAFVKIAILIVYLYLDVNDKITGNYVRYIFTGLSLVTYITIVVYLFGILKFLGESNSVLIAFKVFIGFELINFILGMTLGLFLKSFYYYAIMEIIRFSVLLYLTIQLTKMQDHVLKPSFAFFGGASLVTCMFMIVAPIYVSAVIKYMIVKPPVNIIRHMYTYFGMVDILTLIAVLIILNQVQERLKYAEETTRKDPFLTGHEENSEEK